MNPIILLACAFLAIAAPVLPGREAERGLDSPAIDAHVNAKPSVDSENIGWTVDGNNVGWTVDGNNYNWTVKAVATASDEMGPTMGW